MTQIGRPWWTNSKAKRILQALQRHVCYVGAHKQVTEQNCIIDLHRYAAAELGNSMQSQQPSAGVTHHQLRACLRLSLHPPPPAAAARPPPLVLGSPRLAICCCCCRRLRLQLAPQLGSMAGVFEQFAWNASKPTSAQVSVLLNASTKG